MGGNISSCQTCGTISQDQNIKGEKIKNKKKKSSSGYIKEKQNLFSAVAGQA